MKVIVLGSGVIGVTTAYYLARAGHEVTVVDRQAEPAQETSFANAGEVSPGYSSPWAGPGVPVKAVKWLLMRHGPLVIWPKLDPVMWWWMLKLLRNCTAERYAINKSRMIPIAEYSRDCLRALRAETGIKYDERSQGTLQLFRKQKQLDGTGDDIAVLKQYGVPYEVLDPAGCIAAEPGLATSKVKFVGGLRLPQDETGDCHMFTQALAVEAARLGVQFKFNTAHRAAGCGWRQDHRRRHQRRDCCRPTPMSRRSAAGRRSCSSRSAFRSGLSGEGLFDHGADHRCRRRACLHRDGRKLQGRDHAAWRSHPCRRHRGNLGLFGSASMLRGARRSTIP